MDMIARRFLALGVSLSCASVASFSSLGPAGVFFEDSVSRQQLEYDYKPLAIASILSSAQEAAKLPDIEQRVTLLIKAAQVLPPSRRDDAIRFLDTALHGLRDWVSDKSAKWSGRDDAARLRSDVLSVYVKLDPEKATAVQKESQLEADSRSSKSGFTTSSLRDPKWQLSALDAQRVADATAKLAFSLLYTDFEKASALVVQSMATGVVSASVPKIFLKLKQDRNRLALSRLEAALLPVVLSIVVLDPYSLSYASILVQSDQEMPAAARRGFINLLMNSLETWAALVMSEERTGGLDSSYISSAFMSFFVNVRPAIANYSPEDLLKVDVLLDQVSRFVPATTHSMLQASLPETSSGPKERLADILKDPSPQKRDLRLIRLASELLRKEDDGSQNKLDIATDAISHLRDSGLKLTFGDFVTIRRLNSLAKLKKFIDAQRLAGSISSEETRAWALIALASVARKDDRVLAFEMMSGALKALDVASPSPKKVELTLDAASMLARDDPQRAFDTLSVAARYANSSSSKAEKASNDLASAINLEASIGDMHTKLSEAPETLSEARIDSSLGLLGEADWFRSEQIANDIREPALRLRLKLQFAEAVLASNPKPKHRDGKTKPTVKQEPQ